jgi:hypothetical protein
MSDLLVDIEAIKQLKYRYLRTLDLRLWDEFAECFIPDATGAYGGRNFADRDSLVAYMRENMTDGLISMHQAHHPEIEVDGDRATGTWYLHDKIMVPEFDYLLEGAAFYSDVYVRTPDGWRIASTGYRRTFEMSWSSKDVASLKIRNLRLEA